MDLTLQGGHSLWVCIWLCVTDEKSFAGLQKILQGATRLASINADGCSRIREVQMLDQKALKEATFNGCKSLLSIVVGSPALTCLRANGCSYLTVRFSCLSLTL